MDEADEKLDILTRVLKGLFPNAPFDVDMLATKILQSLGSVGWTLAYDEKFTQDRLQAVVASVRAQHPTPQPFVAPRPPERLL